MLSYSVLEYVGLLQGSNKAWAKPTSVTVIFFLLEGPNGEKSWGPGGIPLYMPYRYVLP